MEYISKYEKRRGRNTFFWKIKKNIFFCISISVVFSFSIIEYFLCNIAVTYAQNTTWPLEEYIKLIISHTCGLRFLFEKSVRHLIGIRIHILWLSCQKQPSTQRGCLFLAVAKSFCCKFFLNSLPVSYRSFINNPKKYTNHLKVIILSIIRMTKQKKR